jgi:alpha-galactosidase
MMGGTRMIIAAAMLFVEIGKSLRTKCQIFKPISPGYTRPVKYMIWFSVPFVGVHTKAYARFKEKVLNPQSAEPWYVLDPRFPEVREYLINLYANFVTRYGIDGLKLDFVDTFNIAPEMQGVLGAGRDYDSVPEAIDRLLSDVMQHLRALNPEILIEFRQAYIGPLMRKYGNMLRAADVPNNFAGNRVRTLDVRLLSGETPAHADMVMWHPDEPVESAAMQILHTLFAVPQISVMLDRIPQAHVEMIRFLLRFWRDHRDVLLDGELTPLSPEVLYPVVLARTQEKLLAACYAENTRIRLTEPLPATILLVNGCFDDQMVLDVRHDGGERRLTVFTCTGAQTHSGKLTLDAGLHRIAIPLAGIAAMNLTENTKYLNKFSG